MTTPGETTPSGLCAALVFHHARLETMGRHALSMLRLEGVAGLRASFAPFQRELEAHFRAEETWILPRFAAAKPAACRRIQSDHADMRLRCDAITVSTAGRSMDERTLTGLLEMLVEHARFEESELYPWADGSVDEESSRAALRMIEAAELGE